MAIVTQVKAYSQGKTEHWPVASGTQAGTVVLSPAGNRPGVAITARGDSTVTKSLVGSVTSITIENGGFSNQSTEATIAVDGAWAGAVATASETTPIGTPVYLKSDGTLTLVSTSATLIGSTASPLGRAKSSDTTILIGA